MNHQKFNKVGILAIISSISFHIALAQVQVDSVYPVPRMEDKYPHWSPDGKMIAFESNRLNGNFEIYTMKTNGEEIRQITSSPNRDETPVWSPDGSLLMYSSYVDKENIEILLVNADGTKQRQITNHPLADGHAKFLPGGDKIIFCSQRDDKGELEMKNYELYRMNLDGSEVERLTNFNGWDTYPSCSPDGEKIIWRRILRDSVTGTYNSEVFMMNEDLTHVTNLTRHSSYDAYPDWSPDGKRIVFASNRHGISARNFQLFIMNADGSNVQQISWNEPGEQDVRPQWSPDGKQIAFNRVNKDGCRIYYLNIEPTKFTAFFNELTTGVMTEARTASRGIAWGDYDEDGFPDILVANTMNNSNFIYRNNGKGSFVQIVEGEAITSAGWTEGVSWIDFDNDGDLDIFATTQGDQFNQLFRNEGNGFFKGVEAGDLGSKPTNSPSSCWCDYDLDGDLDVYVVQRDGADDILYRNRGDGTFSSVSWEQFPYEGGDGRTCTWGDIDGDNYPELYVGNFLDKTSETPAKSTNFFYKNNGDGTFTPIRDSVITRDKNLNYGASFVDYDQDGDLDLFITNIARTDSNLLYQNDGLGHFTKAHNAISEAESRPSKGHTWGDFDNDGDLDLFIANGTEGIEAHKVMNFLFINDGKGGFDTIQDLSIANTSNISAGTAWADYDRDGDLDIFVSNWGNNTERNQFYRNDLYGTNWVELSLRGSTSNYYGIGAKVRIKHKLG
jgi:Tol biopolymer transport system component